MKKLVVLLVIAFFLLVGAGKVRADLYCTWDPYGNWVCVEYPDPEPMPDCTQNPELCQ